MTGRAGRRYVRVVYDYEYTANDGRAITIKQGDECLLLKKTNSEWWSVIKSGEKKPIYVPANYVEEIQAKHGGKNRGNLHQQSKQGSVEDVADDEKSRSSSEDLLQSDDNGVENGGGSCDTSEHDSDSVHNKLTASEDSLDRLVDVDPDLERLENAQRGQGVDEYEPVQYANLEAIQEAIRQKEKDHEYANLAHLHPAFPATPPLPKDGTDPVRVFANNWEMHADQDTGRQYYYNRVSGECTWKPPRGLRAKDSGSRMSPGPAPAAPESQPPPSPGRGRLKSFNSFGTAVVLANSTDGDDSQESASLPAQAEKSSGGPPKSPKVPRGWSQEKTDGGLAFVNEHTNEKYLTSVDKTGRVYYYKPDSAESTWVLPQIPARPSAHHQRHGSMDSAIKGLVSASHPSQPHTGEGLLNTLAARLPPNYRHSVASPSSMKEDSREEEDDRKDLRSPKVKAVGLPSVPDLVLTAATDGASVAGSSEVTECSSPASPLQTDSPSSSLKRPTALSSERRDTLNKTKVTENGKKVKKNWCPTYVVASGSTLYFYKDKKSSEPKPSAPWGRPEDVLDLHGATLEMGTKDKLTSRKNVLVVTLLSGTQWLLQWDDAQRIQQWFGTLSHNLAQMPQLFVTRGSQESLNHSSDSLERLDDDSIQAQLKRKKSRKEKDKGGSTQLSEKEKTNTLDDPNLTFPEKSSRIKDRLRHFFGRRPGMETLQAKGIMKETVFGANLQHLCEREKSSVPKFVRQIIGTIEEKGLGADGIYRVSGNLSQIMKLRFMVDHSTSEKYSFENPDWDIPVLTGALKLFFRELMEPLVPFKHFEPFLTGFRLPDRASRLKVFKDTVKVLPKAHKETMRELFKHLLKVIEHSKENRMQTQNVAIVFGPTLMWPERETQNLAVTTVCQSQIVEFMLLEYKHLL